MNINEPETYQKLNLTRKVYEKFAPIHVTNVANDHCHHYAKYLKNKKKKKEVAFILRDMPEIKLPCVVHLTRIAPRRFDPDNLVSAFKYIFDTVCEQIKPGLAPGRADEGSDIVAKYYQEKSGPREYGLKIEIYQYEYMPGRCHPLGDLEDEP